MTVDTKPLGVPSNWQPEQDKVRLAVLGKLIEECGELASIAARCIIQGIDECDPKTGKRNIDALTEEVADVRAMSQILIEEEDLDRTAIADRASRKMEHKRDWIETFLRKPPAPPSTPPFTPWKRRWWWNR